MSDVISKCETCSGLIDEEELFCANCGAEAPERQASDENPGHFSRRRFGCKGCGASMSYAANVQTLLCPFCGSSGVEAQPPAKTFSPTGVVPFQVSRDEATAAMREYLGRGFWRPGNLSSAAAVVKIQPVFVPYWVFRATTYSHWTADSSDVPFGASGNWRPVSGSHAGKYVDLLVGASSVLAARETSEICPFDMSQKTNPAEFDFSDTIVEQFTVMRKYARPLARGLIEQSEAATCAQYVPGRSRNVRVNVRYEAMQSEAMLLPVWIMAYRYGNRVYRLLVNGQSAQATGEAPVSVFKIAGAIAVAVLAAMLLIAAMSS